MRRVDGLATCDQLSRKLEQQPCGENIVIACYVRYVLDMNKLDAFAEYGRLWIALINRLGGTHHGYCLPSQDPKAAHHGRFSFPSIGSEGPTNIGVTIFSFPDWETYRTIPTRRRQS